MPDQHPETGELHDYAVGKVAEPRLSAIGGHLACCGACQAIVNQTPEDSFLKQLREYVAPFPTASYAPAGAALPSPSPETISYVPNTISDAPSNLPSIDDLHVESLLGAGGMGVVYLARQKSLGRQVALKMVKGIESTPDGLARFRTEARACADLIHPNIVEIHHLGECRGQPYFLLEYVDGMSLAKKISAERLPLRQAAAITKTLAEAMHYAHGRGIIHRDLKPANVLLTALGMPKIADFGLAKRIHADAGATVTGMVLGTPSYMPPEQAAGKSGEATAQSDIYSLGALLYELLTGKPPFKADTPAKTMMQVIADEPVSPRAIKSDVPLDLETICLKCLDKEPARRYETGQALADDLARFLRGLPIIARRTGPVERATKWARRKPAVAALAGVSVLAALILLVAGAVAWQINKKRQANDQKLAVLRDETAASVERLIREAGERHAAAQTMPLEDIEACLKDALEISRRADEQARVGPANDEILVAAKAAVGRAEGVLAAFHQDKRLLARLIDLMGTDQWTNQDQPAFIPGMQPSYLDQAFAGAFLEWGLDAKETAVAEATARIKSRPDTVAVEVIAALDQWARIQRSAKQNTADRLFAIAEAADVADARRRELRKLLAAPTLNRERVRALAQTANAVKEPTLTLLLLTSVMQEGEQERMLRAAVLARPKDVLLRTRLGQIHLFRALHDAFGSTATFVSTGKLAPDFWKSKAPLPMMNDKAKTNLQEAIGQFEAISTIRPKTRLMLTVSRALLAASAADPATREEAIAMIRSARKDHPDGPLLDTVEAFSLIANGKTVEAVPLLTKTVQGGGADIFSQMARLQAGLSALDGKEWKKAEHLFTPVLQSKDSRLLFMANIGLAKALHGQGKTAEAQRAFLEAFRQGGVGSGYVSVAQSLELGKDIEGADAILAQGLTQDPANGELLVHALLFYKRHNKPSDTQRVRQLMSKGKWPNDPQRLLAFANQLFDARELTPAEAILRLILKVDPDHFHGNANLAGILNLQKRHAEADRVSKKIIELQPEGSSGYYLYGWSLYGRGHWHEAEAPLRKAVKLKSELPAVWVMLGSTLCRLEKLDEADKVFRQGIAQFPRHADLYLFYANLLRNQGKRQDAEQMEGKARELKALAGM